MIYTPLTVYRISGMLYYYDTLNGKYDLAGSEFKIWPSNYDLELNLERERVPLGRIFQILSSSASSRPICHSKYILDFGFKEGFLLSPQRKLADPPIQK